MSLEITAAIPEAPGFTEFGGESEIEDSDVSAFSKNTGTASNFLCGVAGSLIHASRSSALIGFAVPNL